MEIVHLFARVLCRETGGGCCGPTESCVIADRRHVFARRMAKSPRLAYKMLEIRGAVDRAEAWLSAPCKGFLELRIVNG